ncbi:hypothetical protein BpHYR1_012287 [Brachionus plicatilis]|uniref:Uncharacterized protein n=1 Tax=Brachionus plicatilis TaxID=10195 RepID=A0A3M7PV63_BRAPC|nr:hypothetical protein BpHYR1_012287 [Brachionus plicatilis]
MEISSKLSGSMASWSSDIADSGSAKKLVLTRLLKFVFYFVNHHLRWNKIFPNNRILTINVGIKLTPGILLLKLRE